MEDESVCGDRIILVWRFNGSFFNFYIMSFRYQDPTLKTSWRSIILLGRNVASYKFALAKTLLEIENKDSLVLLENLAVP